MPPPFDYSDEEVVVLNAEMRRLYEQAARAARGRLPVLVLGETGTGKEHLARAVHRESERRCKPFVAVNCAAIAPALLESALFGHERGAFTGAHQRSLGVFERASGGVLFLDEIGDLGAAAQAALLRAIETQRICRVGSSQELAIDVCLVTATHCDLAAMAEEGTFRRDLYFRLNGVQLELLPLRQRTDEIDALACLFLDRACREWGLAAREFAPDAIAALRRCPWPGNVRQLRFAVERAALFASGAMITAADLPAHVRTTSPQHIEESAVVRCVPELGFKQQMRCYERLLIEDALRRASGNRHAAAKLLGLPLRTLFRKLRPAEAAHASAG
jgi:DNA-binding NtrC family response regulator